MNTTLFRSSRSHVSARQSNIFPDLGELNLISIGQLCDHGFSALFTAKDVSIVITTATLKCTHNTNNGLYYILGGEDFGETVVVQLVNGYQFALYQGREDV